MGHGACGWRRQKGLLQTGFCLLALLCLGSGIYLYRHLQEKVHSSETLSLKFKQQQETLSAQLQVVYEHRSRLERSLQNERREHKKTKEDFLVYKLEAQETLNKEKQDAMNRYGALSSQQKIMKNQHDEVKKQLLDLQVQHNTLKLQNRRAVETHNQKYLQLQQEKDDQVLSLQEAVSKLKEESKLLRKAHQQVHSQLLSAQLFRALGAEVQHIQEEKGSEAIPPGTPTDSGRRLAGGGVKPLGDPGEAKIQGPAVSGPQTETLGVLPQPDLPLWLLNGREGHALRFIRTVNSVQAGDGDQRLVEGTSSMKREVHEPLGAAAPQEKPALGSEQVPDPPDVQLQSWQDIVKKVNARKDREQEPEPLQHRAMHPPDAPLQLANPLHQMEGQPPNQGGENKEGADDEELQMDAGMIDREEDPARRNHIAQEPMMPEDVADPAQDPNNQGEDEFEEAALERPAFAMKAPRVDRGKGSNQPVGEEPPKKSKDAGAQDKVEEGADDYQEDQEQDMDDHGGEVDDPEDLELAQENKLPGDRPGGDEKKDDYY
ncbi:Golgi integral membrane protein 4-like isoform X2 [Ambystoma mexicanum]|uniref:Golgi integral membrane protein 4-like isoform X2 n=1 Tax=Ambystoma mexicanum TaxID=8296 RepID=UPI0037E81DFB